MNMVMSSLNSEKKVHLVSLGCARNRVDSEVMLGSLLQRSWQMTDESTSADAIIINTCGFIQSAKEESIDTILSACEQKKDKPHLKVIVAGCLTQRYKTQLAKGLPEVDFFIGTDEFTKIADLLSHDDLTPGQVFAKRTHYIYDEYIPRINSLTKGSCYVKVAEGCQHNCAFCIIPAIRGRLRSRSEESIVEEVKKLTGEGVKEINLIAQDLAAYGRDRADKANLLSLLRKLVQIEDLRWVRLLYLYPENLTDEFLDFFDNESKILKYLDIPVQHGSNKVLKNMNRQASREMMASVIKKVRAKVPNATIRTSVIVGFPQETEEDFQELLSFVEEMRFDHLGCFLYSQEEGTVAGRMSGQVPEEIKLERQKKVMSLQAEISKDRLKHYLGQTLEVLIEGPSEESEFLWQGRLSSQAPEVDGLVYINDGKPVVGEIMNVKITDSFEYDLVGAII